MNIMISIYIIGKKMDDEGKENGCLNVAGEHHFFLNNLIMQYIIDTITILLKFLMLK